LHLQQILALNAILLQRLFLILRLLLKNIIVFVRKIPTRASNSLYASVFLGNKIIEVLISTVMTPASKAEGKSTPILGVGVVLILGVVVVKVLRF
jgi:hypothetical protein